LSGSLWILPNQPLPYNNDEPISTRTDGLAGALGFLAVDVLGSSTFRFFGCALLWLAICTLATLPPIMLPFAKLFDALEAVLPSFLSAAASAAAIALVRLRGISGVSDGTYIGFSLLRPGSWDMAVYDPHPLTLVPLLAACPLVRLRPLLAVVRVACAARGMMTCARGSVEGGEVE
jgi:hypothetical protein